MLRSEKKQMQRPVWGTIYLFSWVSNLHGAQSVLHVDCTGPDEPPSSNAKTIPSSTLSVIIPNVSNLLSPLKTAYKFVCNTHRFCIMEPIKTLPPALVSFQVPELFYARISNIYCAPHFKLRRGGGSQNGHISRLFFFFFWNVCSLFAVMFFLLTLTVWGWMWGPPT